MINNSGTSQIVCASDTITDDIQWYHGIADISGHDITMVTSDVL